jgi:hypothetical protein
LLIFCLPAGLLALLVYQWLWKPAALSLLSKDSTGSAERTFERFRFWPFSRLGMICIGILIGAFTHLLWDSFTHNYGWMVQHVDALSATIYQGNGISVPLYKLLQHGGTIFGVSVLAYLALYKREWIQDVPVRAWWIAIVIGCASILGGLGYGLVRTSRPVDLFSWQVFLGYSIVTFFMLAIILTTLLSLGWRVGRILK